MFKQRCFCTTVVARGQNSSTINRHRTTLKMPITAKVPEGVQENIIRQMPITAKVPEGA